MKSRVWRARARHRSGAFNLEIQKVFSIFAT
jgi:hypothetical protein